MWLSLQRCCGRAIAGSAWQCLLGCGLCSEHHLFLPLGRDQIHGNRCPQEVQQHRGVLAPVEAERDLMLAACENVGWGVASGATQGVRDPTGLFLSIQCGQVRDVGRPGLAVALCLMFTRHHQCARVCC